MRKYLFCEAGFIEKPNWLPNCWVNVECPTPDDFDFLEKELNVPAAFLHDIADTDERPRIDSEGNWLLTILRIPIFVKDNNITYTTVPIGIITNNEIIISVCYHSTAMIPDLKYLKQINNEVSTAEKELQQSIRNEDLLRLMNLQKCLVYFNTSIRGNEVMIRKLPKIFNEKDYQNPELLEDVMIELKQAQNMVNIYSDILTGTMDAFASIISNNVNTIMKRMTSLSIVLMVPTLIASFYGMNVDIHIEGLPHAFALIVCLSIFLSATAFVIFRKIKWF